MQELVLGCGSNIVVFSLVKAESRENSTKGHDAVESAQIMKRELLDQLEKLSEHLPPNTLDELIDELGGPENVAEVSRIWFSVYLVCLNLCVNITFLLVCQVSKKIIFYCR